MNQFHLPTQLCPACGEALDAATNVTGTLQPEPGDVTVCIGCAAVLRFSADLKLKTIAIDSLPQDNRGAVLRRVREGVLALKAERDRKRPLNPARIC